MELAFTTGGKWKTARKNCGTWVLELLCSQMERGEIYTTTKLLNNVEIALARLYLSTTD